MIGLRCITFAVLNNEIRTIPKVSVNLFSKVTSGDLIPALIRTRKIRIGSAILLTICSPKGLNQKGNRFFT